MIIAVSPLVTDRLSVVMVRVTLHEVNPRAIAMAVAMDTTRIGASISVNSRIHFVGLEECTGRIGNPNKIYSHWWTKQKI